MDTLRIWLVVIMTICVSAGLIWNAYTFIEMSQRLDEAEADAAKWRKIALGDYPVDILNCKVATHGPCYDENTNTVRDARR